MKAKHQKPRIQENSEKKLFLWNQQYEKLLLNEVLVEEPYKHKYGSKERGASWLKISDSLVTAGLKVTQRSVREKFGKMVRDFKMKEGVERKASGVEVEYGEIESALNDIVERMEELEGEREKQTAKQQKENRQAEEMRKKATERLSETRKRIKTSSVFEVESDTESDADDIISPNKKIKNKSRESLASVMMSSLENSQKYRKQEQELRAKELELKTL